METDGHLIGRNYRKRRRENPDLAEEGRPCKRRRRLANLDLLEELIEKIFVMSGFPGVLMARMMSRSWRDKFKGVAGLKDEKEKEAALVFQNQISKSALIWNTYFPIIFCEESFTSVYADPLKKMVVPLVSFLPQRMQRRWSPVLLDLAETRWSPVFLDLDRSLLLMCNRSADAFYMVNIITRSFRVLPPCPKRGRRISLYCSKLVVWSNSYEVYIISRERPDARYNLPRPNVWFVQTYDSKVQKWTHYKLMSQVSFDTMSEPVLVGGVLYMVVDNNPTRLGALDLKKRHYVEIRLGASRRLDDRVNPFITVVDLHVLSGKIVVLLTLKGVHVLMLEVDLNRRTVDIQGVAKNHITLSQCTPTGRRIRFKPLYYAEHMLLSRYPSTVPSRFPSRFPSANGLTFYGDVYLRAFYPGSNLFLEV